MAHITLPDGYAGIVGPIVAYPETGKPISMLAEALLRGPSSLTVAERELIGAYVSSRNECKFCTMSHAATARHLLGDEAPIVDQVISDYTSAPISDKMKALLVIAGKVQQGGRRVTDEDVALARSYGADDKAIHDTVLVAAMFCMANRYVDGLATFVPDDQELYAQGGRLTGDLGYLRPR